MPLTRLDPNIPGAGPNPGERLPSTAGALPPIAHLSSREVEHAAMASPAPGPPDVGRSFGELGSGFAGFGFPPLVAGSRALRGERDGLIVGAMACAHPLLIRVSAVTGVIPVDCGGIAAEKRDRWPSELGLGMLTT